MANKNALLWEIKRNQKFLGFVFGTMHIDAKIAFGGMEALYQKIDLCETFGTEIPLDHDTQSALTPHVLLPNNQTLIDLLMPKKFAKVERVLKKSMNLDLTDYGRFMPLVIINLMVQKLLAPNGGSQVDTIDSHLWSYAESIHKNMVGIETIESHINTLHNIPLEIQTKSLIDASRNIAKFRKKNEKLLEHYQEHDIHKLYKVSKKSLGQLKGLMLYERNQDMVESMEAKMEKETLFTAVGAAHLSGEKGLLSLLKKKNYKLKPIHL